MSSPFEVDTNDPIRKLLEEDQILQFQKMKDFKIKNNLFTSKKDIRSKPQEEIKLASIRDISSIKSIPELSNLSPFKSRFVEQSTIILIPLSYHLFPYKFQNSPNHSQKSFDLEIHEIQNKLDQLFFNPRLSSKYNTQNLLFVKIEEITYLYPLNKKLSDFVRLDPLQSKNFKVNQIFNAFLCDWKLNEQRLVISEATSIKIRDKIITNFLTDLINERDLKTNQRSNTTAVVNFQIRCMQTGLPAPPEQITPYYIQNLFSYPKIKSRFRYFIKRKLKVFLWEENLTRIQNYSSVIIKLYHEDKKMTVGSLRKVLEDQRKPFTNSEMDLIRKEGHKILRQFCSLKSRKANLATEYLRRSVRNLQKNQMVEQNKAITTSKPSLKIISNAQQPIEEGSEDFEFNIDSSCFQERHYISVSSFDSQKLIYSALPKEFDFL